MLEKIGLPAKPSQRGNNWVVDASHCQGCSSQFTFINRKHHCRRCGGLFCNSCTLQRMVLRGQGDSPVRVCEPCKKLEEAARFELRYGHRNRAGKGTGSSRSVSKDEDEILNQIVGSDRKEHFSLGQDSRNEILSSVRKASSSSSSSISQGFAALDGGGDLHSNDPDHSNGDGSASPQELRQRALEERKLYKVLKAEGKSADALKAFKRGKELERQADALEISLRRNRRKGLSSDSSADIENKDGSRGSSRRGKLPSQVGKEKDDLFAELKELGWAEKDLHSDDKNSSNMTLEGELSSLIRDSSEGTNTDAGSSGIDKTQVVAHKRKALTLKREGKLAEAKEELKKAKVLEKQLEEQELLGAVEDSDDEISALIKSIDNDEQDDLLPGYDQQHDFDISQLMGTGDDHDVGGNLDVTDDDFMDPEIAATLKSLGWTDDSDAMENLVAQSNPVDRETILCEIQSLKREALNQKRAGNIPEAMAMLKKAKLLEKDIESLPDEVGNLTRQNLSVSHENSTSQNASTKNDMGSRVAPKSRLVIQKELLAIKKKALSLRREGKLDEAEEELKRGKVLEQQLEEMDNTSKAKTKHVSLGNKDTDLSNEHPEMSKSHLTGEEEGDVTDQDMIDPAYLSVLRNLGWQDQENEHKDPMPNLAKESDKLHGQETENLSVNAASSIPLRTSRKSKAEIQRELLGLKRKALAFRREGKSDEAEEVLRSAKELEDQMAEMEAPKKEILIESKISNDEMIGTDEKNDVEDVTEKDMLDPALISMLSNLGWKDERPEPVIAEKPKSKGEIQRELLNLKRKALAHRRKGETEEAEKLLETAKGLEAQLEALQEVKKAPSSDDSKDRKSEDYDLGKQSVIDNQMDDSKKPVSAVVGQNENLESFREIGRQNSDVVSPVMKSVGGLIPEAAHGIEDNSPLLGDLVTFGQAESLGNKAANKNPGPFTLHHGSTNVVDFLTGDNWRSPEVQSEEAGDKAKKHLPGAHVEEKHRTSPLESLENKEEKKDAKTKKGEEVVAADMKQNVIKTNSTSISTSESKQHSPQQEVLARKRKAVALKREGKLAEAREELRQAKLLEKSLEEVTPEPETTKEVSKSVSNSTPVQQKEAGASNLARKPLSSRDRFKLQQESLSHKRQALKLRREGRMDEAEAEFELAKSLESQLEESNSQNSANAEETADDVVVEDLLDPQLLSALQAIGIGDINIASQVPAKSGPTKVSPSKNEAGSTKVSPVKNEAGSTKVSPVKNESVNRERIQLEERIKAEKVKAVNLKRSGKQAEAFDALRRAKLFEKKLNSLDSN